MSCPSKLGLDERRRQNMRRNHQELKSRGFCRDSFLKTQKRQSDCSAGGGGKPSKETAIFPITADDDKLMTPGVPRKHAVVVHKIVAGPLHRDSDFAQTCCDPLCNGPHYYWHYCRHKNEDHITQDSGLISPPLLGPVQWAKYQWKTHKSVALRPACLAQDELTPRCYNLLKCYLTGKSSNECDRCENPGKLLVCDTEGCFRALHKACLKNSERPAAGKIWQCPTCCSGATGKVLPGCFFESFKNSRKRGKPTTMPQSGQKPQFSTSGPFQSNIIEKVTANSTLGCTSMCSHPESSIQGGGGPEVVFIDDSSDEDIEDTQPDTQLQSPVKGMPHTPPFIKEPEYYNYNHSVTESSSSNSKKRKNQELKRLAVQDGWKLDFSSALTDQKNDEICSSLKTSGQKYGTSFANTEAAWWRRCRAPGKDHCAAHLAAPGKGVWARRGPRSSVFARAQIIRHDYARGRVRVSYAADPNGGEAINKWIPSKYYNFSLSEPSFANGVDTLQQKYPNGLWNDQALNEEVLKPQDWIIVEDRNEFKLVPAHYACKKGTAPPSPIAQGDPLYILTSHTDVEIVRSREKEQKKVLTQDENHLLVGVVTQVRSTRNDDEVIKTLQVQVQWLERSYEIQLNDDVGSMALDENGLPMGHPQCRKESDRAFIWVSEKDRTWLDLAVIVANRRPKLRCFPAPHSLNGAEGARRLTRKWREDIQEWVQQSPDHLYFTHIKRDPEHGFDTMEPPRPEDVKQIFPAQFISRVYEDGKRSFPPDFMPNIHEDGESSSVMQKDQEKPALQNKTCQIIKVLDLFCGAGGTSLGALGMAVGATLKDRQTMKAKLKIIGAVDNSLQACQSYEMNIPHACILSKEHQSGNTVLGDQAVPVFCMDIKDFSNILKSSWAHPEPASLQQHHKDECSCCKQGGRLLCCDTCPNVYHLTQPCLEPPVVSAPEGSWHCSACNEILKMRTSPPDLILVTAPCQNFSPLNHNSGPERYMQNHSKTRPLFDAWDIIELLRPAGILMENVCGLATFRDENGPILGRLVGKLIQWGYSVRIEKMHVKYYSVPSNRARLILQAARPGTKLPTEADQVAADGWEICRGPPHEDGRPSVCFRQGKEQQSSPKRCGVDAASTVKSQTCIIEQQQQEEKEEDSLVPKWVADVRQPLQWRGGEVCDADGEHLCDMPLFSVKDAIWDLRKVPDSANSTKSCYDQVINRKKRKKPAFLDDETANLDNQNTTSYHRLARVGCKERAQLFNHHASEVRRSPPPKKHWKRMEWHDFAMTLTSNPDPYTFKVGHPELERVLTVRECARIQGFLDQFRLVCGMSECYRQIANAVPPPLAFRLLRAWVEVLNGEKLPPPTGWTVAGQRRLGADERAVANLACSGEDTQHLPSYSSGSLAVREQYDCHQEVIVLDSDSSSDDYSFTAKSNGSVSEGQTPNQSYRPYQIGYKFIHGLKEDQKNPRLKKTFRCEILSYKNGWYQVRYNSATDSGEMIKYLDESKMDQILRGVTCHQQQQLLPPLTNENNIVQDLECSVIEVMTGNHTSALDDENQELVEVVLQHEQPATPKEKEEGGGDDAEFLYGMFLA